MSFIVLVRHDVKLIAFRALFGTLLGADLVNIIARMAREMTTRIQSDALDEDHSLALSHPVPSLTSQTRFRVQITWLDGFRGYPTPLVLTYIPDSQEASQLAYTTGHGYPIYVSSVDARVSVFTRVGSNVTNYFVGTLSVNQSTWVTLHDGFEICVSKKLF
jgi:hypothetical protein